MVRVARFFWLKTILIQEGKKLNENGLSLKVELAAQTKRNLGAVCNQIKNQLRQENLTQQRYSQL